MTSRRLTPGMLKALEAMRLAEAESGNRVAIRYARSLGVTGSTMAAMVYRGLVSRHYAGPVAEAYALTGAGRKKARALAEARTEEPNWRPTALAASGPARKAVAGE